MIWDKRAEICAPDVITPGMMLISLPIMTLLIVVANPAWPLHEKISVVVFSSFLLSMLITVGQVLVEDAILGIKDRLNGRK